MKTTKPTPEADPSSAIDPVREALEKFIRTIESTGGLIDEGAGPAPAGDPEWLDLADAYISACKAIGRDYEVRLVPDEAGSITQLLKAFAPST